MIKRLFYILLICLFASVGWGATYNFYISNTGTDTPDGSPSTSCNATDNACTTLAHALTVIGYCSSGDTANVYFDRGDTWTATTASITAHVFDVGSSDPIVNINAYGSGALPIFDGNVADFSAVDDSVCPTAPCFYWAFFNFQRDNCSIKNVEIKRVYGMGIMLTGGESFTLGNSEIHHIGNSAITNNADNNGKNNIVEYNTVYNCMELTRYSKYPDLGAGKQAIWGGGINFITSDTSPPVDCCKDNIIRYNLVYDIYGEGINGSNSTIEYNVIGDTASIGIDLSSQAFDASTAIVRYNLIIMSDWSSSIYDNFGGAGAHGIRVTDEEVGGDNSAGDISIYGNVIINRADGIKQFCVEECSNPYGLLKIYNNTIIDSHGYQMGIYNPEEATVAKVYNNASVRYDTTAAHTAAISDAGWTISYNAFYPVDGTNTVGSGWTTDYVIADPEIPGEDIPIDWDGLTSNGTPYYEQVIFETHLLPTSGALIDAGTNAPGQDYDDYLTSGTDFRSVLSGASAFTTADQDDYTPWDIGSWVVGGSPSGIRGIIPTGIIP